MPRKGRIKFSHAKVEIRFIGLHRSGGWARKDLEEAIGLPEFYRIEVETTGKARGCFDSQHEPAKLPRIVKERDET
jgi:hypothetical protein